jgi:hypothetical protein
MRKLLSRQFWISDDDLSLFHGLALGLGGFLVAVACVAAAMWLGWGVLNLLAMIGRRLLGWL